MKIAVLHDYFDEIGGAELTVLAIAKAFGAPIYTTNVDRNTLNSLKNNVQIISIGRVPTASRVKQYATHRRFSRLRLSGYDAYVFCGNYSFFAAQHHHPTIWFCFSPLRGLYDLRKRDSEPILLRMVKDFQMRNDLKAVSAVDHLIAPSVLVQKRIKKYYHRNAEVVHSPVDCSLFHYAQHKNYWLSVGRIEPYKRVELLLETFRLLPKERLVIIGGASKGLQGYFKKLQKIAPTNVRFLGPVWDRKKLAHWYAECIGLIQVAQGEDFGKTPIEAMAAGKPVIAACEGGYLETITKDTGILISDITAKKLAETIQKVSHPEHYRAVCQKHARIFDEKLFVKKMQTTIQKSLKT